MLTQTPDRNAELYSIPASSRVSESFIRRHSVAISHPLAPGSSRGSRPNGSFRRQIRPSERSVGSVPHRSARKGIVPDGRYPSSPLIADHPAARAAKLGRPNARYPVRTNENAAPKGGVFLSGFVKRRYPEAFLSLDVCAWQAWQRPTFPRLETKYHRRGGV